jgi:hypothetical protein
LIRLGTPARKRGRQLLQRPPHWEVERVDLDRDPATRAEDVLAEELPALAQRLGVAVQQDRVVGQLATALAGVAGQHADPAIDVELRVAQRRARAGRQRVQLGPLLAQEQAE